MTQSQKISALSVVAAAVLGILFTVIAGNQPLLGLDLQGGVSVVLEPTGAADGQDGSGSGGEVTGEALDLTVELLRGRIDQIGVAEPEISRQGDNIVVALPGLVEDQEEALARLRQTAELRFRPVLLNLGPGLDLSGGTDPDADPTAEDDSGVSESPITTEAPADDGSSSSSTSTSEAPAGDESEDSLAGFGRFGAIQVAQGTTTTTEAAADEDTTTTEAQGEDQTTSTEAGTEADGSEEPATTDAGDAPLDPQELGVLAGCLSGEVTPDTEDGIDDTVILEDADGFRFCLGPAVLDGERLTGDMVETAGVGLGASVGWQVNPTFRPGPDGIDKFNAIAQICYVDNFGNQPHPRSSEVCPTAQLAVVLDHEVISAPSINAARFARDQIVISGSFQEAEARRLAESLRFGALPIELVAQETRTVSASIGQDVLRSGVIAGLIGLSLVAVYLLAYYRLAGLVAISGLVLSAALLWTIVAWFGSTFGLALTLAGVVGLIVAIGVSADSNIVYFENVKDSYRSGRRVPTAVERAYQSAISTIVKADVVSLIAAVLLYLLTVGAVRGFAFYLGLATILDLIISWMFMRPALGWLARRSAVEANPRLLGLPTDGPAPTPGNLAGASGRGGAS